MKKKQLKAQIAKLEQELVEVRSKLNVETADSAPEKKLEYTLEEMIKEVNDRLGLPYAVSKRDVKHILTLGGYFEMVEGAQKVKRSSLLNGNITSKRHGQW